MTETGIRISVPAALHNSRKMLFRAPFGARPTSSEVVLRIALRDPSLSVRLRLWRDGEERFIPMQPCSLTYRGMAMKEAWVDLPAEPGLVWYSFWIDGLGVYQNAGDCLGGEGVLGTGLQHSYQITVYDKNFKVPAWAQNGVMYQIFPDRFSRSSEVRPPEGRRLHARWEDTPDWQPTEGRGEYVPDDFFGGNLPGITEKLEYLRSLGVTVLYLNPIFEAASNHRYDTGNYFRIDGMLGTLTDFRRLCQKAGELHIRVILDGVFSHTGSDSIYFNREGRYESLGAYQSPGSPYAGWYTFERFPDKYRAWWGVPTLPETNEEDPGFMNMILGEHGVVPYWLGQGASGWRLDVADELPDAFLAKLRQSVKKKDKDALVLGEVWEDATHKYSYGHVRPFAWGGQLDTVMNYPMRGLLLDFLRGRTDARAARRAIESLRENYPPCMFYALMNMTGTHDVPRAMTLLGGGPDPAGLSRADQARVVLTEEQRRQGVHLMRALALLLFALPGLPSVYYGDEAGMEGMADPFNRAGFPWQNANLELITWFASLGRLRNETAALRGGDLEILTPTPRSMVVIRRIRGGLDELGERAEDGFAFAALNLEKEPVSMRLSLPGFKDASIQCQLMHGHGTLRRNPWRLTLREGAMGLFTGS
ncbi:glycoside hydrolase family 13 protein [Gehongia tenuis]|uniref:Glycoside hydrolase family 13 protein n=1 Tax=Gehongia tenuis TaxID=2763655 RepID=A0A926D2L1_9FIRM|nr:glycoside hydrolase family 13 protein [Gehongia tenuis]